VLPGDTERDLSDPGCFYGLFLNSIYVEGIATQFVYVQIAGYIIWR